MAVSPISANRTIHVSRKNSPIRTPVSKGGITDGLRLADSCPDCLPPHVGSYNGKGSRRREEAEGRGAAEESQMRPLQAESGRLPGNLLHV